LLPLNLCQPPLLDCGVAAAVDPGEVEPRFGLAALADAGVDGVTCGNPPFPVVAGMVEPGPRTVELFEFVTGAAARVPAGVLADRVMACLCCSNDT
jgi:hypothetical protein